MRWIDPPIKALKAALKSRRPDIVLPLLTLAAEAYTGLDISAMNRPAKPSASGKTDP